MKRISAIRARYHERQREIADRVLQQDKRRFILFHGVLYWSGFGLVMGIVIEYQQRVQPQSLWALENLIFLLGAVLFFALFGYLYSNWKWKDYERIVKG